MSLLSSLPGAIQYGTDGVEGAASWVRKGADWVNGQVYGGVDLAEQAAGGGLAARGLGGLAKAVGGSPGTVAAVTADVIGGAAHLAGHPVDSAEQVYNYGASAAERVRNLSLSDGYHAVLRDVTGG